MAVENGGWIIHGQQVGPQEEEIRKEKHMAREMTQSGFSFWPHHLKKKKEKKKSMYLFRKLQGVVTKHLSLEGQKGFRAPLMAAPTGQEGTVQ